MHRAETSIIPLGQRDGYPDAIDFEEVDQRLERSWIAARLKKVTAKPELSKFFRKARKDINSKGLAGWMNITHQSNDAVLNHTLPG
jgi:hypothetical protein